MPKKKNKRKNNKKRNKKYVNDCESNLAYLKNYDLLFRPFNEINKEFSAKESDPPELGKIVSVTIPRSGDPMFQ